MRKQLWAKATMVITVLAILYANTLTGVSTASAGETTIKETPTDVAYYFVETKSGESGHLKSVYPAGTRGNHLVKVDSISANDGIEAWKVSRFSDGKAIFDIQSAEGNRSQALKYASHKCETASWTGPNFWDASRQVFIMYCDIKGSTCTTFDYGYHGNCLDKDAVPIKNDPFFINNTGHSLGLYHLDEEQYNELSKQLVSLQHDISKSTQLPAPGNVLTSYNDDGLATIKWGKVDGAKYYHVYMKNRTNPTEVRVSRDKLTETICNYQMKLNQEYEFRVCAVGPDGKEGVLSLPQKESYVKRVKVTGVLICNDRADILDPNGHNFPGHSMYVWDEITMYEQDSMDVIAFIFPDNASNTKVAWSCSNPSLVKLIPTQPNLCRITTANLPWKEFFSGEYVTVTATTNDGSKRSTMMIHVNRGKPIHSTVDSTISNQSSIADSDLDEIVQATKEYKEYFDSNIYKPAKTVDQAIQFFGGKGNEYLQYYGFINKLLNRVSIPGEIAAIDNRNDLSDQQKWVEKADLVLIQFGMWTAIPENWRKDELYNFSNQFYKADIQREFDLKFEELKELNPYDLSDYGNTSYWERKEKIKDLQTQLEALYHQLNDQ